MLIRKSRYVHLAPVAPGRVLLAHAFSQLRLVLDEEVAGVVAWFGSARDMPSALKEAPIAGGADNPALAGCLAALMEHGILTSMDPEEEAAALVERLSALHGRDPGEALDQLRRGAKAGADPYWSVSCALDLESLGRRFDHELDLLLFGDCELQMEADFLRRAAAERGVGARIATGFPGDLRLAGERAHDAIFIGALRSRRMVAQGSAKDHGGDPSRVYIEEARRVIAGLRTKSAAPIFIDNLPEPTVQPLGLADRGPHGHRNRFRRLNLHLESLAEEFADVYVVDIAAALNAQGAARLVDDGLVGFTHFGAPGWMLQRPQSERAAVHDLFPDMAPLAETLEGRPYGREVLGARAHMDALSVVLGLDRKKCVIVDLDGTLWPGVLAETGAPFAWTPEVSGAYSYIGLYFGLHEALKALKRRGVLLACVSKNDEDVVRALWRYADHYPKDRLLSIDDFVTLRINWRDKAANVASICEELGFPSSAFVFVDDHPVERERVQTAFPDVWVLGEDPFSLRRTLLTDPRLQAAQITEESAARTDLVRAQLERDRQMNQAGDAAAFLEGLELVVTCDRPSGGPVLDRVRELLLRTTQFNTTGARPSADTLGARARGGEVFVCSAKDRFGDYGLVAAAVLEDEEIAAFVMSCRVIGLGVEQRFLAYVLDAAAERHASVVARIVETSRNGPSRHLYADAGFDYDGEAWRLSLARRRKTG